MVDGTADGAPGIGECRGGHRPLRHVQERERSPVGLVGGREVCTRGG